MNIRLEYPELEMLVMQLKDQETAFSECVLGIGSLVALVLDAWEGEAACAYREQFNELQPNFEKTRQLIEKLRHQILKSMMAVKELDEDLARKLNF